MFKSFFPHPKWFFGSFVLWAGLGIALWYSLGHDMGVALGFELSEGEVEPVIGLGHFTTPEFLWLYTYVGVFFVIFAGGWMILAPHRWHWWSVVGSCIILFVTYYNVQVSVAINNWFRPFYDLVQKALSAPNAVAAPELFGMLATFCQIAFVYIAILVLIIFFVNHYIFRWRTAMNEYYTAEWSKARHIEGASQRVQEDTMRFARIMEDLGTEMVKAVMTLVAFLPILLDLSQHVTELPLIGQIPAPLVFAAIFWATFGTGLLALFGLRLPGLEFKNQRVEAAYRKELVLGEDSEQHAGPLALADLFENVRRNYFKLFLNYTYFNVARYTYLQADNVFAYVLLVPTIVAGQITLGILQQIQRAFGQVSSSFQFLVQSWTTIIELLSVQKRLASFEAAIEGRDLDALDVAYEVAER